MEDCIFCKIASGEIKSDIIYEDDKMIFFNDLNPTAPIHFLAVPKKHIRSLNELEKDLNLIGEILFKIKEYAEKEGFAENGYRVVNNCGEDGLQSIKHIHFHVLAGKKLAWPAG